MNSAKPLDAWINHVFDHAVANPRWYWFASSATPGRPEKWHETPADILAHITRTFENPGKLLSRFSDEQLDQGFWYLFYRDPDFMGTLFDIDIPLASRIRAIQSFVPLFEQVMAARATHHLSHLDEKGANPLNIACYMWFDELPDRFHPEELARAQLGAELVLVLSRILAIPHDACRESALHGIGHWVCHYPQLANVVDEFLTCTPGLRPELVAYAESARAGNVL